MRKLLYIAIASAALTCLTISCEESTWDLYEEWRVANEEWLAEQQALTDSDGTPYYTQIVPSWYPKSGVLIHYFNDRSLTEGNLTPLVNSTVDVKYIGRLYNDEAFDSSYTQTTWGDSIYRVQPINTIVGWQVALTNMRVGDSARVIIPFMEAYGVSTTSSTIPPYSNLAFDIKLVDIYKYEMPNY